MSQIVYCLMKYNDKTANQVTQKTCDEDAIYNIGSIRIIEHLINLIF